MMNLFPILLALAQPWVTGNFPRELFGPVDTRPTCYGHADADSLPIKFHPPVGYRVHITHIRGDLLAWAVVPDGQPEPKSTSGSGALAGFSYTAPDTPVCPDCGSVYCDWCADSAMVYVQTAFSGTNRAQRTWDYDVDGYLGPDNVMVLKIAAWLNTTGYPVHVEVTWSARFEYVK